MQSEFCEHVARIAEDPLGSLRRIFTGSEATRLVYQYRSEWADVNVQATFELHGESLVLIGIHSRTDTPDDAE